MSEIQSLLDQGTLAYSLHDYEKSVQLLGEACRLLDDLHGSLAQENGDGYFLFGRALLQLAIQNSTVLGQSQVAVSATETEIEPTQEKDEEDDDDAEEEDDDATEEEDDDAAEDDFEQAWLLLDMARIVFGKETTPEKQLKLADTLLLLGDVCLETERFDDALTEYQQAIHIKKTHLSHDNRQLAEAHYKHALALEFSGQLPLALTEIENAVAVVKRRLSLLESSLSQDIKGKGKSKADDKVPGEEETKKEMDEIRDILPDMEAKVEELKSREEREAQAEHMLQRMLATHQPLQAIPSHLPVNDVTGLVKRKTPSAAESDCVEKKQKKDE
ncbi:hypothetical protein BDF14DRAFT_1950639 [Spinellus fusiger]|nr:hypothetical protein BDF14DRAFT_1950639 [Spinellus fusiger]